MSETPFVSSLVENHGVFHVVTGVRNDSYDSIHTLRTEAEVILSVVCCPDQGSLWEQDSVDLVVHAVWMVVIGSSHGLLGHLALIHVSWRLIVVSKWNC